MVMNVKRIKLFFINNALCIQNHFGRFKKLGKSSDDVQRLSFFALPSLWHFCFISLTKSMDTFFFYDSV